MDLSEFIAKEDINRPADKSNASEGVSCNDKTVKTSNLSSARQQDNLLPQNKQQVNQIGPLTLTPTLLLTKKEL